MKALQNIKGMIVLGSLVLVIILVLVWVLRPTSSSPGIPPQPDFTQYPAGSERKEVFLDYFLHLVKAENADILTTREQLLDWYNKRDGLGAKAKQKVVDLAQQYRVEQFAFDNDEQWQQLIRRVDVVPPSLALAQAANESAWGTSRFAQEANNYYGQWCFSQGCGVVPQQREEGKTHEVAKFDSPYSSVSAYILNINSHPAYQKLRVMRAQQRSSNEPIEGLVLAQALDKYSERGEAYIEELQAMIRHNQLQQYDGL